MINLIMVNMAIIVASTVFILNKVNTVLPAPIKRVVMDSLISITA